LVRSWGWKIQIKSLRDGLKFNGKELTAEMVLKARLQRRGYQLSKLTVISTQVPDFLQLFDDLHPIFK
jgi:hypothetical protein